ncbi:MAG: hypothetical protein MPK62_00170 [Alphaproteobacteria bacterium]|nr:hypothetical protein [Alphaproteobacteria bacterium]MDA8029552.1 hypothetical protein [Alphaproteobacteria bacterium]
MADIKDTNSKDKDSKSTDDSKNEKDDKYYDSEPIENYEDYDDSEEYDDPKYSDNYIATVVDPDFNSEWKKISDLDWITPDTSYEDITKMIRKLFLSLEKSLNYELHSVNIIDIKLKVDRYDKMFEHIVKLLNIGYAKTPESIKIYDQEFDINTFNMMTDTMILHNILLYQEISYKLLRMCTLLSDNDLNDKLNENKQFVELFNKDVRNPIAHADYEFYDEPINNLQFFTFNNTVKRKKKTSKEKAISENTYVSLGREDLFMRMQYLRLATMAILSTINKYIPIQKPSEKNPLRLKKHHIYYKTNVDDTEKYNK